jgi:hypothetical protein
MESITKPKILAVEGTDEINFFTALLKVLKISDVQILDFKGKTNFSANIKALPNIPGYDLVSKIGLIRDADDKEPKSAFDSLVAALNKVQIPAPTELNSFTAESPSVGIFIMPDNVKKGMLEDLCLKYVEDLPENKCIEEYFCCINKIPDELSKSMIQIYLAGKNPLVNSLGLGALKNHFDFSSPHFDTLKGFLNNFK